MYIIIIDYYNGRKEEYYTELKSAKTRIKELEKKTYIDRIELYNSNGDKIYSTTKEFTRR